MPDIRSEVTQFEDTSEVSFAKVKVYNPDGLPVVYEREFIFVKNRFLATRELVTFEASFHARVDPRVERGFKGHQLAGGKKTVLHKNELTLIYHRKPIGVVDFDFGKANL